MRIDQVEIRDADIFEILLDSFPDMIHSVDDEGRIVYTNKRAEALLGYTRKELTSMNVRQLYADEVLDALNKGFTDLKERGDKTVESLLKAKDGTKIPVEIRSFSIYDDEGNFIRTFSILRDIRAIKDLQNGLKHASRLAAIGEMASGVAHDINNPLTVILLSNEMLVRTLDRMNTAADPAFERLKAHARDTQKASNSIRKLVDHLRNFARGIAEQHECMDLYDSISDAVFMTHSRIQNANVTLRIDPEIKKGHYFISGCPNQIEQVFVNLIGNACDAMNERETRDLTLAISPATQEGVDCWKCTVQDTGAGIPRELFDDVFQSFFTTKEKGKGTGLGLSISRGIIKEHKGDISLESEVGRGTVFSVLLPRIPGPE